MLKCFDIKKIVQDEDGAVTVDWVVLTAMVVGLAGTAALQTKNGVNTATSTIQSNIGGMTTGTP